MTSACCRSFASNGVRRIVPHRNLALTGGGLKGGISVALALALPDSEWKPIILAATYIVVLFSIIVQGLTVARLATRPCREPELV